MRLKKGEIVEPFECEITERPWGFFERYTDNIPCTSKILFIKKGETLSLQWHFKRDQFYYLIDGDFTIEYSNIEIPESLLNETNDDLRIIGFNKFLDENLVTVSGNEGDFFGFKRKIIHSAKYIGNKEFGRCLDLALGENDENDIIRLRDKYNRNSLLD